MAAIEKVGGKILLPSPTKAEKLSKTKAEKTAAKKSATEQGKKITTPDGDDLNTTKTLDQDAQLDE